MFNGKVSISSQIVLMFIPLVDIWAFYRIKKLRKFVLFAVIPVTLVGIIGSELIQLEDIEMDMLKENSNDLIKYQKYFEENFKEITKSNYILIIIGLELSLVGLRLYLVIIWSNNWNKQFLRKN